MYFLHVSRGTTPLGRVLYSHATSEGQADRWWTSLWRQITTRVADDGVHEDIRKWLLAQLSWVLGNLLGFRKSLINLQLGARVAEARP
jgi:hypothetical protein